MKNWLRRAFGWPEVPVLKTFTYGYQTYPFDDGRARFSVRAETLEQADALAQVRFAELVKEGCTVMHTFFFVPQS